MWKHVSNPRTGMVAVPFLVLLTSVAGCGGGDNLPRQEVNGSVTIDGKPLVRGLITFVPTSAEVSTQGGGPVLEGKFSIPRMQGLVPGKYKVVISSPDDKPEVF